MTFKSSKYSQPGLLAQLTIITPEDRLETVQETIQFQIKVSGCRLRPNSYYYKIWLNRTEITTRLHSTEPIRIDNLPVGPNSIVARLYYHQQVVDHDSIVVFRTPIEVSRSKTSQNEFKIDHEANIHTIESLDYPGQHIKLPKLSRYRLGKYITIINETGSPVILRPSPGDFIDDYTIFKLSIGHSISLKRGKTCWKPVTN